MILSRRQQIWNQTDQIGQCDQSSDFAKPRAQGLVQLRNPLGKGFLRFNRDFIVPLPDYLACEPGQGTVDFFRQANAVVGIADCAFDVVFDDLEQVANAPSDGPSSKMAMVPFAIRPRPGQRHPECPSRKVQLGCEAHPLAELWLIPFTLLQGQWCCGGWLIGLLQGKEIS